MLQLPHTAFYISHNGEKDLLLHQLIGENRFNFPVPLHGLKGGIFSNATLQYFIAEELLHDHFEIATENKNTLAHSSSGEQRKALLAYIIARQPGYLIIDNIFDSLDTAARQSINVTLTKLAAGTLVIQLFSRRDELLPFIETVYTIAANTVTACQHATAFRQQSLLIGSHHFAAAIPPPLTRYSLPPGPLVKMNHVSVQYDGRCVLTDICWQINPGEFWQLTGPNGSGKSTLLSLITGNSPKGYGQDLWLFGRKKGTGESVWQVKENTGYFTPAMALQFERQDSIEQMIISGFFDSVGLYIKPSDIQVQLAQQWLVLMDMDKKRGQPFRLLPEADQRMVLIARAMVKHPPLLILDEPVAGLDDEMAALVVSLINKIAAETSTAILYVSHRTEAGLSPNKIFQLFPSAGGSAGAVQ